MRKGAKADPASAGDIGQVKSRLETIPCDSDANHCCWMLKFKDHVRVRNAINRAIIELTGHYSVVNTIDVSYLAIADSKLDNVRNHLPSY